MKKTHVFLQYCTNKILKNCLFLFLESNIFFLICYSNIFFNFLNFLDFIMFLIFYMSFIYQWTVKSIALQNIFYFNLILVICVVYMLQSVRPSVYRSRFLLSVLLSLSVTFLNFGCSCFVLFINVHVLFFLDHKKKGLN